MTFRVSTSTANSSSLFSDTSLLAELGSSLPRSRWTGLPTVTSAQRETEKPQYEREGNVISGVNFESGFKQEMQ